MSDFFTEIFDDVTASGEEAGVDLEPSHSGESRGGGGRARDARDVAGDLAAGDGWVRSRLPLDFAPRNDEPGAPPEDPEKCFMCCFSSYLEGNEDAVDVGAPGATHERERHDAYTALETELRAHIKRGTPPAKLVEAVWQFYETHVRDLCDFGEWSRKSVYDHIFSHMRSDERLYIDDMQRLCSAKIDFLRKKLMKRSVESGEDELDMKVFGTIQKVHKTKLELFERARRLDDKALA